MNFNKNILKIASGIIHTLKEDGFFEQHPFVGEAELSQHLKEKMQVKYKAEGEMLLTDKEFVETCNQVMHESLTDTMESLLEKGAIQMALNTDGEIVYSANPDFDIDSIFEDDE